VTDIDWLLVDNVCRGIRYQFPLKPDEKRMVVRRLADKLLSHNDDGVPPGKMSAHELAERLGVTGRSIERYKAALPPARKQTCPVCREPMWVLDNGVVEPHGDRIFQECVMSGRQVLRGLAAQRPDLYPWLQGVAS